MGAVRDGMGGQEVGGSRGLREMVGVASLGVGPELEGCGGRVGGWEVVRLGLKNIGGQLELRVWSLLGWGWEEMGKIGGWGDHV